MQAENNQSPGVGPSRNPLSWTRRQVVPRIVTTASLTSHVHFMAGPGGSSDPVFVLLHGIGMSHRYYRKLQALLAEHGDTLAIDLPGFGGTPTPDRQLSVADYAAHTATVLEKMGVARAVVVGHSMGTQFATELAVQRPDLVSHIALLGPVVDPERRTVLQQSLSLGLDSLMESPVGNALVLSDYARSGMRWYLTELPVMMTYDIQARLALASQPVLVVRGSRDPVAPRTWCHKLTATAPNGRFLEIPGKPHIVQHGAAARTAAGIISLINNNQR
ncbi:MAG: alpha/beta hydrolase [Pseudarthrobacter sp.]|nr:alpha/beta hydrolase [Pseudarthrobacter sp.]